MDNSNFSDKDDFEFKPLTEGLGFHQKKNSSPPSKPLVQFKTDMPEIEMNSPLPRTKSGAEPYQHLSAAATSAAASAAAAASAFASNTKTSQRPSANPSPASPTAATNTVDEILKTLNQKKGIDTGVSKASLKTKSTVTFKPAAWEVSASLLDAMLVTAATLFCLILLLLITRVDLFANIYHPDSQGMVYWSLAALVASISWIYLVCNRIFLGFTPGEWVFDQRLGQPEDQATAGFALKSILRSTLVIATGFVIIPAISFALNDDVLGKITGLRLFKKA